MKRDYRLVNTRDEVQDYFIDCATSQLVAVDTETDGGTPWSVQWSVRKHTGRMILADKTDALHELGMYLSEREIILHNAPGDLDTLERLGIVPLRFRDTMQELYHQCSLPQGLKVAAYRLLGVEMRSWSDVVLPASTDAVLGWMRDGLALAEEGLEDVTATEMKTYTCLACGHRAHGHKHATGNKCGSKAGGIAPCQCVDYLRVSNVKYERRPSVVSGILKHVTRYTTDTREDDEPYDPWDALARMRVEGLRGKRAEAWEWEWLEQELGSIPILSIANAEMSDAVEYAVGDADATGMVAVELERLRGDTRWEIDDEDVDV